MERRFEIFTLLIAGINRCIHKIKAEEVAEFNLKTPHVSCLYYLYKTDGITAGELCELCDEDKANISRSIKFLRSNDYLTPTAQGKRQYQLPLKLTEKGRRVGRFISQRVDGVLEEAGAGLSEEHRTILYKSLSLIHDNLLHICRQYGTK